MLCQQTRPPGLQGHRLWRADTISTVGHQAGRASTAGSKEPVREKEPRRHPKTAISRSTLVLPQGKPDPRHHAGPTRHMVLQPGHGLAEQLWQGGLLAWWERCWGGRAGQGLAAKCRQGCCLSLAVGQAKA